MALATPTAAAAHAPFDLSTLPWRRVADALGSGLMLVDQDGRVVHWNAWMVRHSGIGVDAALGRPLEDVLGSGLSQPFRRSVANVLKHRLPVVLSTVLHRHPLPLYRSPPTGAAEAETARIPQSVMMMPIAMDDGERHLCMVQVTDTSMFVKRERVLQSNSDRLSKEAVIDGLTGVYNRKFFDDKLRQEFRSCARQQMPMSLLMLDVDAFKDFNDHYGHPAGDRVLVAIVTAAHSQLNRASDVLARYGGEEFAGILSACDHAGAVLVAEKIRHAIAELRIPHAGSNVAGHITVSVGAATAGPAGQASETELLDAADRALYQAKRGGRNMVAWLTASAPAGPPAPAG